jgi:hypothetical protein
VKQQGAKMSAIASRVLRVISGAHYWNQVREFSQFCVLLVFGDEEIGRLDVAMDHVLAVKQRHASVAVANFYV